MGTLFYYLLIVVKRYSQYFNLVEEISMKLSTSIHNTCSANTMSGIPVSQKTNRHFHPFWAILDMVA